jgi:GMP synthase (glutamine-hydrolysing)
MGGPMGIYDEAEHPWLIAEKKFIEQAVAAGKIVLGICLGAQLIADVLGAGVYRNRHREIGWFDVQRTSEAEDTVTGRAMPAQFEAFHWHGDTFDLPEGARLLAESAACKNQGFIFNDRVLALQFHLETIRESAVALIENCGDELDGSQYVQSAEQMLSDTERFSRINQIMTSVINALATFRF